MNIIYYVNILACAPLTLIHKLHTWSRDHSRKEVFSFVFLPDRYLRDLTLLRKKTLKPRIIMIFTCTLTKFKIMAWKKQNFRINNN